MPPYDGHYKWEDSPGLEHHCGTCSIPLHNPRALQTCFGVHVEPCYRFHQQLHFVQKSHECFGCKTADEMRFKRHGVIAKLVKVIKNHDKDNAVNQPKFERKRSQAEQDEVESTTMEGSTDSPDMSIVSNDYGFKPDALTRKQQKAQRKTEKMAKQVRGDPDSITKEELDHVSEAIYLKTHTGKSASFADSNGKEIENDPDLPYGEGIDPQLVAENLFFSSTQRRKYFGKGKRTISAEETPTKSSSIPIPTSGRTPKFKFVSGHPTKSSPSGAEDPLSVIDPKIFERLGTPVTLTHDTGKKRRDFIKKLALLINEDMSIVRKEDEDTRMRQAGFWRFVSSATLANMVELHKGFCWATGELKNKEKYGEGLEVTEQGQTLEEELIKTVGAAGAVKQVESKEAEDKGVPVLGLGIGILDKQLIPGTTSRKALQDYVVTGKKEKYHKRLSSQEGFMVPKSKTNIRSKTYAQCLTPKTPTTPPLARNVLRIVDTNRKYSPPDAGFIPVPVRASAPAYKASRQRGTVKTTNFFGGLEDMEA